MFKNYVKILFVALAAVLYAGCSQEPYDWTEGENLIKASDFEVVKATESSVNVSFLLRYQGDMEVSRVWVEYSENGKTKEFDVEDVHLNGVNTVEVKGLWGGTYYLSLSAYAEVNGEQVSLGSCSEQVVLEGLDAVMPRPSAVDVTAENTSIYVHCTLYMEDTDVPVIEAGFFYGTNDKVSYETGTRVKGQLDGEALSAVIDGLNFETVYYVGAYVTTEAGTLVSSVTNVMTKVAMNLTVYDLRRSATNGFSLRFTLTDISEGVTIDDVRLEAGRKDYFDLYGYGEFYWTEASFASKNVERQTIENGFEWDLSQTNLTSNSFNSRYTYMLRFIVDWTDDTTGKSHQTVFTDKTWRV